MDGVRLKYWTGRGGRGRGLTISNRKVGVDKGLNRGGDRQELEFKFVS